MVLMQTLENGSQFCTKMLKLCYKYGHTTSFFKLIKSIKQECSIFSLVFLIVVEVATIMLQKAPVIDGISVDHHQIKLCQLARDMTLFLRTDISCKGKVYISLYEEFYRYTGLTLIKE